MWAQLITAYYLAEHQSDALDAYQRLRTALADDLGIDPGPTLRALHGRILRQETLDAGKLARSNAGDTLVTMRGHIATEPTRGNGPVLRRVDGSDLPLDAMNTRIGRSPDNDVVLDDAKVSRHHAAIIDTGSNFVIADLKSANGVYVQGRRIHPSATLTDGDVIDIGNHQFTFEAAARE